MARKAGFSHALAALVSTVLGAVLIAYLQPHFPAVFARLEVLAQAVEVWGENRLGIDVESAVFVPALVAAVLAFVWGVVYHLVRHGRSDSA